MDGEEKTLMNHTGDRNAAPVHNISYIVQQMRCNINNKPLPIQHEPEMKSYFTALLPGREHQSSMS